MEKEIKLHSKDEVSKEQNMMFYDKFQESLINDDKKEASKYLNWIERGLNSTAALLTVVAALGL
ncbi:hypothetical protein [Oceanobacillus sojae]|uniref:hypothetical protein n=1 Tax=Oceanobacillus sojae TaxID=582851 RepID=UPI0021A6ED5D|nr:hypothetical protein [Oceanobacillus sojae]MCT1901872.1 hypothetical protein [Oceanobacillus sojae]